MRIAMNHNRKLSLFRYHAEIIKFGGACLVPFLALAGNVAADGALVLTILIYFFTSEAPYLACLKERIFQLSLLFWIWILMMSAISATPQQSFQDSLPWIRFPLYAFSLSMILTTMERKNLKVCFYAACLATTIELGALFIEYFFIRSPETTRLYGTFSKLIPGWYLACFGLLTGLIFLEIFLTQALKTNSSILGIFYVCMCSVGIFMTGEIMMMIFFFGTIAVFFSTYILGKPKIFLLILLLISFLSLIFIFDDPLRSRILFAFEKRIPWYESSDYYPAWKMGLMTFIENPFFGVGPKNINSYCEGLKQTMTLTQTLGLEQCLWHPHNLYLQIAAETGVIGLLIFIIIAGSLIIRAAKLKWSGGSAIPLSILIISFFPIQTYSQAFGQSKNFFLWTTIGIALSFIYNHKEFYPLRDMNKEIS